MKRDAIVRLTECASSLRAVWFAVGRFISFSKCSTWTGLLYILLICLTADDVLYMVSCHLQKTACVSPTTANIKLEHYVTVNEIASMNAIPVQLRHIASTISVSI